MIVKNVDFEILAGSQNITALIRDRLIRLTVKDAAGIESDAVTIEIDNRDQAVKFPSTGAVLDVSIGWTDELFYKGRYEVDEVSEPIEIDTLTIHAKAAKMKGEIKAPKNATFDDITFSDLVDIIAKEHGYKPAISADLGAVLFDHIDQNGESDINLLTRLARLHGAIAKPVADRLMVVEKGASKTVSGKSLPVILIDDKENSTGVVSIQERGDYKSVSAFWFDDVAQKKREETAGEGKPHFSIRTAYKKQSEAKSAATAKLRQLSRGRRSLPLARPLSPEIVPESLINILHHKPSADGLWLVEDVEHVIDGGSVAATTMNCVSPDAVEKENKP